MPSIGPGPDDHADVDRFVGEAGGSEGDRPDALCGVEPAYQSSDLAPPGGFALRVCSRRGILGRARLLPSRALGNDWLGRSLALPLQEPTLSPCGVAARSPERVAG